MPSIDVHEIFSQNHMYFSTGSHFAQNLKMGLLSLSLNLEAQYGTLVMDPIWGYLKLNKSLIGLHRKKL